MNSRTNPAAELEELASRWQETKERLAKLREYQLDLEERMTALVGVKEEGTTSAKTRNFRVTTTGGLNRVLEYHDADYWRRELGEAFDEVLTSKLSLKLSGFRNADQAVQDKLMAHMVIKPKKVALKVEQLEEVSHGF